MLERDSNINPETGAGQALLLRTLHYFHRISLIGRFLSLDHV
jgi:hypothetical protein